MGDMSEFFGPVPAVWKRQLSRIWLVETVASAILFFAVLTQLWPMLGIPVIISRSPGWPLLILAPFAVAFIAGQIWRRLAKRSWNRRAAAADYFLCTQCGYDLSNLRANDSTNMDTAITCPECAATIEPERARRAWRTLFNVR